MGVPQHHWYPRTTPQERPPPPESPHHRGVAEGNQELFNVPGQGLTKSSKLQQVQLDWGEGRGWGGPGTPFKCRFELFTRGQTAALLQPQQRPAPRPLNLTLSQFCFFFFPSACTGGRPIEGIRYPPSLKLQTHTRLSAYQGHKSHWRPKDGPGLAGRPGHSDGEGRGSLSHASTKEC